MGIWQQYGFQNHHNCSTYRNDNIKILIMLLEMHIPDFVISLNIFFNFSMRDKMYLIFLNFFLESGLLELPLHSVPEGPQTNVASTPLSEGLHSNSTSSPSSRLLNPDLWTTDYTRKYKLA